MNYFIDYKMPEGIELENFEQLLTEEYGDSKTFQGQVILGTVTAVSDAFITVDVGLKSEGIISKKEFGLDADVKVGDKVDVYVEKYENRDGLISLSREKARREEAWIDLERIHKKGEKVNGVIFGRVKGGFTVDLKGAIAFLPGSQVDVRPIKDITPLMGIEQPFEILKMDKIRGNIVVSRRSILEEDRAGKRTEIMSNLKEGETVEGVVKNITDYGAFIDLGGIDGLLHVTDISWQRVNHPSEVLKVGQTIKAQIIRFNSDSQRVSLGLKQLENDPWKGVQDKYKVNNKIIGKVTNIADYGAFVELESGVEGLVHVSEMSWTRKNLHPSKILASGQEVEVMILEVDEAKRRISLGIKQCSNNPWAEFASKNPIGSVIEGEIRNITEFGLFVAIGEEIDGMVHLSDLSWESTGEEAVKSFKKGENIKAKVLDIDAQKERVSLGVKQIDKDPFEEGLQGLKKGDAVNCIVKEIDEKGLNVDVNGVEGFIKKVDFSKDKAEQKTEKFNVGDKVEAKITSIDAKNRKIALSIKALEIEEEKKALSEYGSSDSGASLGDILGAALAEASKKKSATKTKKAEDTKADDEVEEKAAKKTKAAKKKASASKKSAEKASPGKEKE